MDSGRFLIKSYLNHSKFHLETIQKYSYESFWHPTWHTNTFIIGHCYLYSGQKLHHCFKIKVKIWKCWSFKDQIIKGLIWLKTVRLNWAKALADFINRNYVLRWPLMKVQVEFFDVDLFIMMCHCRFKIEKIEKNKQNKTKAQSRGCQTSWVVQMFSIFNFFHCNIHVSFHSFFLTFLVVEKLSCIECPYICLCTCPLHTGLINMVINAISMEVWLQKVFPFFPIT